MQGLEVRVCMSSFEVSSDPVEPLRDGFDVGFEHTLVFLDEVGTYANLTAVCDTLNTRGAIRHGLPAAYRLVISKVVPKILQGLGQRRVWRLVFA